MRTKRLYAPVALAPALRRPSASRPAALTQWRSEVGPNDRPLALGNGRRPVEVADNNLPLMQSQVSMLLLPPVIF